MDEELEETDEVMEPHGQYSVSSEEGDNSEEIKFTFHATRAWDSSNIFDFTGPPVVSADQLPLI